MHQLIDADKRRLKDHCTRRLGGDVTVYAKSDADSSSHHRRGVVDAVAKVECVVFQGRLTDQFHLLFGTLAAVGLGDAHACCEESDFRRAVS